MIKFKPIPVESVSNKKSSQKGKKVVKNDSKKPFRVTSLTRDENLYHDLTEEEIEYDILHIRQLLSKLIKIKIKKQSKRIALEIERLKNKNIWHKKTRKKKKVV